MLDLRGTIALLLPNETIGLQIAHLRKERKLSQAKLAAIAGLYPKYLSDVETGRKVPRMDTVARLAAALGVTIEELCGMR